MSATDQSVANFQEQEEKLDGDASLNKFVHELYGAADEDMRRAMAKSFVRSLCYWLYTLNRVLMF